MQGQPAAVTAVLRSATGLDWSVAIIGLCKATEIEVVHRIAEPLRLAASGQDMTADLKAELKTMYPLVVLRDREEHKSNQFCAARLDRGR
jgi:hypothetical protein